jgi:hypothetical protein
MLGLDIFCCIAKYINFRIEEVNNTLPQNEKYLFRSAMPSNEFESCWRFNIIDYCDVIGIDINCLEDRVIGNILEYLYKNEYARFISEKSKKTMTEFLLNININKDTTKYTNRNKYKVNCLINRLIFNMNNDGDEILQKRVDLCLYRYLDDELPNQIWRNLYDVYDHYEYLSFDDINYLSHFLTDKYNTNNDYFNAINNKYYYMSCDVWKKSWKRIISIYENKKCKDFYKHVPKNNYLIHTKDNFMKRLRENTFYKPKNKSLIDMIDCWDNMTISGGIIFNSMNAYKDQDKSIIDESDIDIFFYGEHDKQKIAFYRMIEVIKKNFDNITCNKFGNRMLDVDIKLFRKIQLIITYDDSIIDVLDSYDLDCAKVCYDGTNMLGTLQFMQTVKFWSTSKNIDDIKKINPKTQGRIKKMMLKGMRFYIKNDISTLDFDYIKYRENEPFDINTDFFENDSKQVTIYELDEQFDEYLVKIINIPNKKKHLLKVLPDDDEYKYEYKYDYEYEYDYDHILSYDDNNTFRDAFFLFSKNEYNSWYDMIDIYPSSNSKFLENLINNTFVKNHSNFGNNESRQKLYLIIAGNFLIKNRRILIKKITNLSKECIDAFENINETYKFIYKCNNEYILNNTSNMNDVNFDGKIVLCYSDVYDAMYPDLYVNVLTALQNTIYYNMSCST